VHYLQSWRSLPGSNESNNMLWTSIFSFSFVFFFPVLPFFLFLFLFAVSLVFFFPIPWCSWRQSWCLVTKMMVGNAFFFSVVLAPPFCTGFVVVVLLSLVHSGDFTVADADDSVEGLFHQHCFLSSCCFLCFFPLLSRSSSSFSFSSLSPLLLLFSLSYRVLFLSFYSQNCMRFFFYIKDVR